jgi:aquaporin Z
MSDNTIDQSAVRKYIAELIGTFALVFFGCGSVVMGKLGILDNNGSGGILANSIGILGIAFAFGITVLIMVYAIGPISGCHINPAITIAMLTAGKIAIKDAVAYIVSQCVGATLAAATLLAIASGNSNFSLSGVGLGQNGFGSGFNGGFPLASAFVAEIVLTFFFLIVIFGATSEDAPKGFAGIAIGLSLFVIHIVGIPIDGTSVNPARSLGPAIFVGGQALSQLWVFIVAPIIGGVIAALVWMYVLKPSKKD